MPTGEPDKQSIKVRWMNAVFQRVNGHPFAAPLGGSQQSPLEKLLHGIWRQHYEIPNFAFVEPPMPGMPLLPLDHRWVELRITNAQAGSDPMEQFRRSVEALEGYHSSLSVQRLLSPILLELAPAERLRLSALAPHLGPVGFEIAELSGGTLALTSMPAVLSVGEAEKLVMTLGATSGNDRATEPEDVARGILEALAASQACKAAIKMHHPLSAPAMEALVSELFASEQPFACPHGRPIVLQMTDGDLERRFGRR